MKDRLLALALLCPVGSLAACVTPPPAPAPDLDPRAEVILAGGTARRVTVQDARFDAFSTPARGLVTLVTTSNMGQSLYTSLQWKDQAGFPAGPPENRNFELEAGAPLVISTYAPMPDVSGFTLTVQPD